MNKRTWQTPNPRPWLHRLEPVRGSLAWWQEIPASRLLELRRIGHIGLKRKQMSYVITLQMGSLAKLVTNPPFKSP
jgi:hypothetical protein